MKNKLPPNNTNSNTEIPAVPNGPTLPPSAVSNPGIIGTGPSFLPESNPNGSDFFGGSGSPASKSFPKESSSSPLVAAGVSVANVERERRRDFVVAGGGLQAAASRAVRNLEKSCRERRIGGGKGE